MDGYKIDCDLCEKEFRAEDITVVTDGAGRLNYCSACRDENESRLMDLGDNSITFGSCLLHGWIDIYSTIRGLYESRNIACAFNRSYGEALYVTCKACGELLRVGGFKDSPEIILYLGIRTTKEVYEQAEHCLCGEKLNVDEYKPQWLE